MALNGCVVSEYWKEWLVDYWVMSFVIRWLLDSGLGGVQEQWYLGNGLGRIIGE